MPHSKNMLSFDLSGCVQNLTTTKLLSTNASLHLKMQVLGAFKDIKDYCSRLPSQRIPGSQ